MQKFQVFPKSQGVFPYIYLFYFMLPVSYALDEIGLRRIIAFILLTIFLISFRQLYWEDPDHFLYSLFLGIQLAILPILYIFYDFNYLFLGFFPASFIGWYTNKKHFITAASIFIFILTIPMCVFFIHSTMQDFIYILPFYMAMLISPFANRMLYKQQELTRQLDQANAQIKELVQRDERIRIARDLHDTLGHTLSLITLKSQLVEKTIKNNPEKALKEATEIKNTSRLALKQVRELVTDMRAFSITETLIEIRLILESAHIQFNLQEDINVNSIPRLTQNIISLCIKESITNIVKHSRATVCTMHMERDEGNIIVTIQDNGIGLASMNTTNGNGLKGISERLTLIEGTLSIESNNGVTITLSIPIVIRNGIEEGKVG